MSDVVKKRSVCFIPSGEGLRQFPVEHWIQSFSDFTRRTPGEIVLPAVGFSGPFFDSALHPCPSVYDRNYRLPDWIRAAREKLGEEVVVWASIIVECGFFDNEAICIQNQYMDNLGQICLTNPVAQEVLSELMREIIAIGGVDGIALDITDIYPNSGATGLAGISASCFCDHCVKALGVNGFREQRESFMGEESFLRLVLKLEKGEGAAHIDPTQDWIDQMDAKSLVSYALARGFVAGDRATIEKEATRLLKYFGARVKVTSDSLKAILATCKETDTRTALVLGSADADLSQLATLAGLDRANAASEYWLPDAPDRATRGGSWRALQMLAGRSTYYVNAFFETVEKAQERILHLGERDFLQDLLRTSKRLMSNKIGAGSAYIVDKLPQYDGFVGIPIGTDDHLAIVKRLATEVTGAVLPQEVLEQFRIADPMRSV